MTRLEAPWVFKANNSHLIISILQGCDYQVFLSSNITQTICFSLVNEVTSSQLASGWRYEAVGETLLSHATELQAGVTADSDQ